MSEQTGNDKTSSTTGGNADKKSAARSSKSEKGKPKARSSGARSSGRSIAFIALCVAILALAGVAFGGWQWWQNRHHNDRDTQQLRSKVTALKAQVSDLADQQGQDQQAAHKALQDTKDSLQQARDKLADHVAGLSGRLGSVEDAVAAISRRQRQGMNAARLDQVTLLLRMGRQRYQLFHDAGGAMQAYARAADILQAVQEPQLGHVRQALNAEREALAKTHPGARNAALATLSELRQNVTSLPLQRVAADDAEDDDADQDGGFWHRLWHGLSTAVVVKRTDTSARQPMSGHLTRQLTALTVAQAQAATLDRDAKARQKALQQLAERLKNAFDGNDAGVRKARQQVARLQKHGMATADLELGKALDALQDWRDVNAAATASSGTAAAAMPAPAASANGSAHTLPASPASTASAAASSTRAQAAASGATSTAGSASSPAPASSSEQPAGASS